jgi:diaminopropionate ammonia-lyase
MAGFVLKPSVRLHPSTGMFTADEYAAVQRFYQSQPPTPLHTIGNLLVKDESQRLGLNAFKILGVRYAIERLRQQDRIPNDATLACATDGNHGRAVARTAARLGYLSHIYLPKHASPKRIRSIQDEGAEVHIVDGNYDDAVRQSALEAQRNNWVIVSDTSWPGYEEIPRDIVAAIPKSS